MNTKNILKEISSMLYWTMLAACTVGPGTVVTCARAGAEYGLNLIWALVFASILAFTLQEGTARLTIVSGKSLGQCLRIKYRHGWRIYETAVIGWVVSICVFLGNTLYECNNWAGGIDAIIAVPGAKDLVDETVAWKIGFCVIYAVVVIALLVADKTEMLGIFLGLVMMAMVGLFLSVVTQLDINLSNLGFGFLPNLPEKSENAAQPTDIIISLVGTTSIGFNLFLGGSMAKGKTLVPAQRGIAFSTASAFVVSVLILIVGSTNYQEGGNSGKFEIADLAKKIEEFYNEVGRIIFGLGFVAAAVSSMLTVPLGAALTADSIFSDEEPEEENLQSPFSSDKLKGQDNPNFQGETGIQLKKASSKLENRISMDDSLVEERRKLPRWMYMSIMVMMVIIAAVTNSCINTDERQTVILIAQVFNGVLLPFFSICLLLCINDPQFMGSRPQTGWANTFLVVSVTITLFLASNVIIQKVLAAIESYHPQASVQVEYKLVMAGAAALIIMTILQLSTTLAKDIIRSFSKHCWTHLS